jgi:methylated-DNA-protein-cysteine methyltransferase-like protein
MFYIFDKISNKMKFKQDAYNIIWQTVKQVPRGKVATYGHVAELSGLKGQARLVGYALHNLPDGTKFPWHRVINAQGRISFPTNSAAYRLQKTLLEKDGVKFSKDKIDLNKYGWINQLKTDWKNK